MSTGHANPDLENFVKKKITELRISQNFIHA